MGTLTPARTFRAIYKCRLCGKRFEEESCSGGIAFDATMTLTGQNDYYVDGCGIGSHLRWIHNCENGGIGLADFCGFKLWEENDNNKEKYERDKPKIS
jgi:hypothetical protein